MRSRVHLIALPLLLTACARSNADREPLKEAPPAPSAAAQSPAAKPTPLLLSFTEAAEPPRITRPARLGMTLPELEQRWKSAAKSNGLPELSAWKRNGGLSSLNSAEADVAKGIRLSAMMLGTTSQIEEVGLTSELLEADPAQLQGAIRAFVLATIPPSAEAEQRVLSGLGFFGTTPIPSYTSFAENRLRYSIHFIRFDPSKGVTLGNLKLPGTPGKTKETLTLKVAAAEETINRSQAFALRTPYGKSPGFGSMNGFSVYSAEDSGGKSFGDAVQACHEQGFELCTEPQWQRLCAEQPALRAVETWTASMTDSHDALQVRGGGDSCDSGKAEHSTNAVAGRVGLCCQRSTAFADEEKKLMFSVVSGLEDALNTRDRSAMSDLLAEELAQYQTKSSVPHDQVVRESMADLSKHPERWIVFQDCRNNPDATDRMVVDCDKLVIDPLRASTVRTTLAMGAGAKLVYWRDQVLGSMQGTFSKSRAPGAAGAEPPALVLTAPPSSSDQLSENTRAGNHALKAADQLRKAYDVLRQSFVSRPDALEKLDLAQRAWQAYSYSHEHERFPDENPQFAYGSVYPTCVAAEREELTLARAQELLHSDLCQAPRADAEVQTAVEKAEAALNENYRKVRLAYAADSVFLAAFKQTQLTWLKFRDAQVEFAVASNPASSTCSAQAKASVDRARTAMIQRWLNPPEEGDVCRGSFGPPQ